MGFIVRKLIVNGGNSFEISFFMSFFNQKIQVVNYHDVKPTENDLLLIILSSMPLLGWGMNFQYIFNLKRTHRCSMLLILPDELISLSIFNGLGKVISGRGSIKKIAYEVNGIIDDFLKDKSKYDLSYTHFERKQDGRDLFEIILWVYFGIGDNKYNDKNKRQYKLLSLGVNRFHVFRVIFADVSISSLLILINKD